jgi:hypothetical protein
MTPLQSQQEWVPQGMKPGEVRRGRRTGFLKGVGRGNEISALIGDARLLR